MKRSLCIAGVVASVSMAQEGAHIAPDDRPTAQNAPEIAEMTAALDHCIANGFEYLALSFALKKIAAVEVAVNREFRGVALGRMIRLTRAPLLFTSGEYLEVLSEVIDDLVQV